MDFKIDSNNLFILFDFIITAMLINANLIKKKAWKDYHYWQFNLYLLFTHYFFNLIAT